MDAINLGAVLSFVFITTYTPGPNNISSAAQGVQHGYRRTLAYLLGITVGFFAVMLLCGWLARTLLVAVPGAQDALRVVGAGYILWLAWHTAQASYGFGDDPRPPLGFWRGLALQFLNPKVILYGLALYGTLLAPVALSAGPRLLSAGVLSVIGLSAVSTWALGGAAIRRVLQRPTARRLVNLALALTLVYNAIELSGVLRWLS